MSLRPRPEVENLQICPHGGIDYAELNAAGLSPEEVIDFSVCTNPFMPPPKIRGILKALDIERYPDTGATEFRQRLSERLGIPADNILAGSGTTELIRIIAFTYLRQHDPVLILEPTYGDYEVACRIAGAEVVKQWLKAEDGFRPGIAETAGLVRQLRPRGVFICNPNNPTGKYLSRQEIEAVLEAAGDGLLVLDEAYISFIDRAWASTDLTSQGNVVILRSMTKDYNLAGLRLGYAIAGKKIIDNLRRVCPPWNVNIIAQKAGAAALEDASKLELSMSRIRKARDFLVDGLSRLGLPPLPSDAHYFLVRVGNAHQFRAALLKHGIMVRDCTSFGLPEYIRLSPRSIPRCRKLLTAIGCVLQK